MSRHSPSVPETGTVESLTEPHHAQVLKALNF
jgi:hypothetical protein